MGRFFYRSLIHRQNLSCFREWEAGDGCYFLVAASGLNTRTFLNSEKMAELRQWPDEPELVTDRIETLCRLFIEGYRQASLRKNPHAPQKTGEEIIESLGMLWLDENGNGYVYQAGKCIFSIQKENHTLLTHPGAGILWYVQTEKGDRMVMDLKRADLLTWLRGLPAPEQSTPGEIPLQEINYPFSVTWVDASDEPVLSHWEPEIAGNRHSDNGQSETAYTPEKPTLPQETAGSGSWVSEPAQAVQPTKDVQVKKQLFITIAFFVTAGFLLAGWLRYGTFPDLSSKQPMEIASANEIVPDTHRVGSDAVSLLANSAQEALTAADEHLREGRNAQALVQLDSAEQRFLRFLSLKPDARPSLQPKLNEIMQKKELVRGEENF